MKRLFSFLALIIIYSLTDISTIKGQDTIITVPNYIVKYDSVTRIDTTYIISQYERVHRLFAWMGYDSESMLYGLDHVRRVCAEIDNLVRM